MLGCYGNKDRELHHCMMNGSTTSYYDVINSADDNFQLQADALVLFCDVVIILAAVLGIIENTLICICILKNRSLRTYINATLISTLIGDLIACVTLLPLRVYLFTASRTEESWDIICSAAVFFRTFCDTLQLFMLIAVSYERYQSVANPFKKDGRAQRTAILNALSWSAATGLGLLSVFVFVDSPSYDKCLTSTPLDHLSWGTHDLFLIFPVGIGTLIVIVVFYGLIMFTLFKHRIRMAKHSVRKKNKVVPQVMINDEFKGVDKSYSNTDISVTKTTKSPSYSNISEERSSKYCDTNMEIESNIDDVEGIVEDQQECKVKEIDTSENQGMMTTSYNSNDNAVGIDVEASSVKENVSEKSQSRFNEADGKPIEKESQTIRKNGLDSKLVQENDTCENLKPDRKEPDNDYKINQAPEPTVKVFLNTPSSPSKKKSMFSRKKKRKGANSDNVIQIFDINGVVNRVAQKETTYAGAVCVMNPKNKVAGKRKVEAKAAKRIAILIGVFACLWMPLPLTVLTTINSEFSTLNAQLLVVTTTMGLCSVVVNPFLHSILNKQLRSSLRNMLKLK